MVAKGRVEREDSDREWEARPAPISGPPMSNMRHMRPTWCLTEVEPGRVGFVVGNYGVDAKDGLGRQGMRLLPG